MVKNAFRVIHSNSNVEFRKEYVNSKVPEQIRNRHVKRQLNMLRDN